VLDERIIKPRHAICARKWRNVCGYVVVTTLSQAATMWAASQAATMWAAPHCRATWRKALVGSTPIRGNRKDQINVARRNTPLLAATAVERMAIFASVAKVPDARIRGMALARLDRDEPFAAADKALELDGGKRVLRQHGAEHQKTAERQSKNDVSLFHIHTQSFPRQCALRNNAD
jgi:hypothetical protein